MALSTACAFEFRRAQHRRGVGGEERIAGAGGEQHDAALAEIFHRALAVVGFAHRGHGERRQRARLAPCRSMAASSTRQFITVASMPMVSPTGRGTPRSETSTPRKILPPPTTTPSSTPSLAVADQIGGEPLDHCLIDAEALRAGERFAGQLDDDAAVERVSSCVRSSISHDRRTAAWRAISSVRRQPRPRRRNRFPASQFPRQARSARSR